VLATTCVGLSISRKLTYFLANFRVKRKCLSSFRKKRTFKTDFREIVQNTAISGKFLQERNFANCGPVFDFITSNATKLRYSAVQIYNTKTDFSNIPMFLVNLYSLQVQNVPN
jgi:hypothetical protein